MVDAGHPPVNAGVGPGIGACCFEVGPEVAERFARSRATTTWGTASVDLGAVLTEQLAGLETWALGGCTFHDDGWFSHRKDGTASRLAAIGWIP
jgi:copper oxidase (laccase) domain-containing protein